MRLFTLLFVATFTAGDAPDVTPPGNRFAPPPRPTGEGAPLIYKHSASAGPDETFLLVGENLTTNLFVWGESAN